MPATNGEPRGGEKKTERKLESVRQKARCGSLCLANRPEAMGWGKSQHPPRAAVSSVCPN